MLMKMSDFGASLPIDDAPPCPALSSGVTHNVDDRGDSIFDHKNIRWRYRNGSLIGCIVYGEDKKIMKLYGGDY